MAAPIDSATIVSTANAISIAFNILWPIITGIVAYIVGHKWTSKVKSVDLSKV